MSENDDDNHENRNSSQRRDPTHLQQLPRDETNAHSVETDVAEGGNLNVVAAAASGGNSGMLVAVNDVDGQVNDDDGDDGEEELPEEDATDEIVPNVDTEHSRTMTRTTANTERGSDEVIPEQLPAPREHSYLPGNSHPLLVGSPSLGEDGTWSPTQGTTKTNKRHRSEDGYEEDEKEQDGGNTDSQMVLLPILELHGVVLFPGSTIPIRLGRRGDRALLQYLARQIEQCRQTPHLQPEVQLGIMTYVQPQRSLSSSQEEEDSEESQDSQDRRQHRRHRRRRRRRSHRQLQANIAEDDDNQGEISSGGRRRLRRHRLVSRIGTIATITYTHETAALDNPSLGDSISSSNQIWDGAADELVVTAIGTNRFRVLSYVQEESFADLSVFQVQRLLDKPLVSPKVLLHNGNRPFASLPRSNNYYNSFEPKQDSHDEHDADDVPDAIPKNNNRDIVQKNRLVWNLSMVTPVPYTAYRANTWPWMLVAKVVNALEKANDNNNEFAGSRQGTNSTLPSLDDLLASKDDDANNDSEQKRDGRLEPTRFSYKLSSNLPFTDEEKLRLLKMDSTVERLRTIYSKVQDYARRECHVCCKECDAPLTSVRQIFTVGGAEGATSNYVNPNGFIHQITTLRGVDDASLFFQGYPSTENSYFPGYSWTITYCQHCYNLLGWKFLRVAPRPRTSHGNTNNGDDIKNQPDMFFGFMSSALATRDN